jgi:hypothetical protein
LSAGGPTFAAQIGAPRATGPTISHACTTSLASLIDGQRRAPTGMGAIAELPGALEQRGGGLFTGCVAGDTARPAVPRLDG